MALTPKQKKDLFKVRLAARIAVVEDRKDRVYKNVLDKLDAVPSPSLKRKLVRLLDAQIKDAVQSENNRVAQVILDMGIENAGEIVSMIRLGGRRALQPSLAVNERLGS